MSSAVKSFDPTTVPAAQRDTPHKRIRVLTHRWLPLLLRRVGVGAPTCELVRERFLPDAELGLRLKIVRDAALLGAAQAWAQQDRQTAELADAAAAIAGQLSLAIELAPHEPALAELCLTRASEQLVSLMVVSNPPSKAPERQQPWWQRLRHRLRRT